MFLQSAGNRQLPADFTYKLSKQCVGSEPSLKTNRHSTTIVGDPFGATLVGLILIFQCRTVAKYRHYQSVFCQLTRYTDTALIQKFGQ